MTAENESAGLLPGHIGHYRLLERVGVGGMGTVYRALDERSGAVVALKVMHPHLESDQTYLERFRREAHVASLLRSPYTVQLQEFGHDGARHFLVSEFVEGPSLGTVLKDGPIEPLAALAIAVQVALSLDEAESRGIVHRDIKPENILLTNDASVKVTDFGIARMTFVAGVTMPGMFVGTLAYSAPEQHSGQTDARSDIYSLGVVLFEMLAGECPFSAPTPTGLIRLHEEAPPPLGKLAGAPPEVVAVVAKCLEKDPSARYQRASELIAALEAARLRLGRQTGETWMSQATAALVTGRSVSPRPPATVAPSGAAEVSVPVSPLASAETRVSAGHEASAATGLFQAPPVALPVAVSAPGMARRIPLPLLIVGSMLLAALVATGAVFAAMRAGDSGGAGPGADDAGGGGATRTPPSPGTEPAERPMSGGVATPASAVAPSATGSVSVTASGSGATPQAPAASPTTPPPTAAFTPTAVPPTPTAVPPTPTPTEAGYPPRSIATGGWYNSFTVVANNCGAGPAVGEVWYYTYDVEEIDTTRGYVLDGEGVDVYDEDGYYLGTTTLNWPRLGLSWDTLDGGRAILTMTFSSATQGSAEHSLEYPSYGCGIRSVDRG